MERLWWLMWCVGWTSCLITTGASVATAVEDTAVTQQFQQLMEREWDWRIEQSPTFATYLGYKQYNDRWDDSSLAAIEARHQHRVAVLRELDAIDPATLAPADRINYRLFRREYAEAVESFPFGWYLIPLTQREGIQTEFDIASTISFDTVRDYEDWLARLESFGTYMDQVLQLLATGIERGVVHSRVVMERLPGQIRRQIVERPEASSFYAPFEHFPRGFPEDEAATLRERAKTAIRTTVVPAFERMLTFFEVRYLPACSPHVGCWQVPRGQELYALRARQFTTTDLTPQQIHELGLSEVARIREQMEAVVRSVEFEGDFQAFLNELRTDPRFYFTSENELLEAYRGVCKQIDPQLIKLFKVLPRMPYGVEAIPAEVAPDTTAAYYREPAQDGTRAGTYFVNLYDLKARPRYEIEVLSVHEAVPGHHLQIALAMELDDLPEFRRLGGYTAFIEGWALYSESLGSELGLYTDPYSRFGQLTYEMWRAVRLVVDTGMHSLKWSRDDAIEFFRSNTAKSLLDIENEVDRYIAWPGQALAYKVGELKIQELRRRAETELGDRFDVREFHHTVLKNGAVTLDVLEELVLAWIAEVQAAGEATPAN